MKRPNRLEISKDGELDMEIPMLLSVFGNRLTRVPRGKYKPLEIPYNECKYETARILAEEYGAVVYFDGDKKIMHSHRPEKHELEVIKKAGEKHV